MLKLFRQTPAPRAFAQRGTVFGAVIVEISVAGKQDNAHDSPRFATSLPGLLALLVSLLGLLSAAAPARSEEACSAEIPPLSPYLTNPEAHAFYPFPYFSFWNEPPGFRDAIAAQDYDTALQILQALSPIDRVEGWLQIVQSESFQGDRAQLLTEALALLRANPTATNRDDLLVAVAEAAIAIQRVDLATAALRLVADEAVKARHLGEVVGMLRAKAEWNAAQALETEIYTALTSRPDYQAVLLSQIAAQYAQVHQPERARRFFAQAQIRIPPVEPGEREEAVMQSVTHSLIVAGELEPALEMMASLQDPAQRQVDFAIALAQQGQYRASVEQIAQISPTFTSAQLPHLIRLLIDRDQVNCAMQVAVSPLLHSQDLAIVLPDLVGTLIKAGRKAESLTLLQNWSQSQPWGLTTAASPLVTTLVAAGATDIAEALALSFDYPNDRLVVLVTLTQALAQTGDTATALEMLTTAEQAAAADLAMPPMPPPVAPGEVASPPIESPADQVSALQQRKSILHAITLAPAYDAVGQPQRAVAQLDAALRLTLTPAADAWGTNPADSGLSDSGLSDSGFSDLDEASLTHQVLHQYAQLRDPAPMVESLQVFRQTVLTQPDADTRTRRLDRIAYGLAISGAPDAALQTLPFDTLSPDTQQQIVVALAQQHQFEIAQSLATQLTIADEYAGERYWLTAWAVLAAEFAQSGQVEAAEQAFQQILSRLSTDRTQEANYVDYWADQAQQQYAEQGLYDFAQRLVMASRVAVAPDFQALDLPLSPQTQAMVQIAKVAIDHGDANAGLALVRALPIAGDRARALACIAIALQQADQADLAHQALAEATTLAHTLPNHIGKTQALLDISQAWIDLDQPAPVPDLLAQAAMVWE